MWITSNNLVSAVSKALLGGLMILGIIFLTEPASVYSSYREIDQNSDYQQSAQETTANNIYLPVSMNLYPAVKLYSAWTTDADDVQTNAFLPNEEIHLYASGLNISDGPLDIDFSWSLDGPCGSGTLYDGSQEVGSGYWNVYLLAHLPECSGVYTGTVQVAHSGLVYLQSSRFVINNPSAVALSDEPAFDKCGIPSAYQLQTWMENSPYRAVNIYIGGIHRACANSGLDAFWINEVSQQGWKLIPTWVGPQAPCSQFKHRISSDPQEAYVEGKIEADAAGLAADRLGLMGGNNIIYYDMEGYSSASSDCREATKEFIKGWVERLHEFGYRAGAYGGACSSYISDWATINPMPDNVWIADWKLPAKYDEDASVWNTRCLDAVEPNTKWANHQRIRQYAGDHAETWGGVSLGIDSNISDGEVAFVPQGPWAGQSGETLASDDRMKIQRMQLLPSGQGWLLAGQRLLWTENAASQWRDITPGSAFAEPLLAAHFVDESLGWLVSGADASGDLVVHQTTDGGNSWQSSTITDVPQDIGSAYMTFIDSSNGWLVLKLQSSSNFSLGKFYRTVDAGASWQELSLPVGEPVRFIDANRGWVAGGAEGNEIYSTSDGGATWQPRTIIPVEKNIAGNTLIDLPVFDNQIEGVVAVTFDDQEAQRVELYATEDGGNSWSLTSTVNLKTNTLAGSPAKFALAGSNLWLVASPESQLVPSLSDKTLSSDLFLISNLPEGVVNIDFSGSETGWAHIENGICSGEKFAGAELTSGASDAFRCAVRSMLFKTADGGRTWLEITP